MQFEVEPRFRELMTRIVDREGRTRVVVDLAGTDFMDGLGALISGLKTTRLAGGDLRIARPGTQVMTVLKLTKRPGPHRARRTTGGRCRLYLGLSKLRPGMRRVCQGFPSALCPGLCRLQTWSGDPFK